MTNMYDFDLMPVWNNAGDFSGIKSKSGKDKRITDKRERKELKAYRNARKNRHTF